MLSDRIEHIKNRWFFTEPACYLIVSLYKIEYTPDVFPIAVGHNVLYFNEEMLSNVPDSHLEEYIKLECTRVLLKHPYERCMPNREYMYAASNACIADYISFKHINVPDTKSLFHNNDMYRETYEKIYKELVKSKPEKKKDNSSDIAKANTAHWGEDDEMVILVNDAVDKLYSSNSWGSLPNEFVGTIFADNKVTVNYNSIIKLFTSSVISSSKVLTRMKPNRRFGYNQIGTKVGYTTNVLIVIDTSGSVGDKSISKTLGFIGGFLKNGISSIDVIQFDVSMYDDTLQSFTKKPKFITTESRGGTDVDDIVRYINERSKKHYDGIIICTDGYFTYNKDIWKSIRTKVLWALNNTDGYEMMKKLINKREKITYLNIYDNE